MPKPLVNPTSSAASSTSKGVNPKWDPTVDPVPVPKGSIVIQKRGAVVTNAGLNHQIAVFRRALEMFAGLLSKKDVKLISRGTDCFTNGSTIVIPELSVLDRKGMTDEEVIKAGEFLEAIRGFVSHEVGHVLYSDLTAKPVVEFAKESPLNRVVWNALEDVFVEKMMAELWQGVGLDLSNMNEWTKRKLCDPVRWSNISPVNKVLMGFMDLATHYDNPKAAWFYNGMGQTLKDAVGAIEDEIEHVRACQKTKDVIVVAKRVVDKLKQFSEAAPEEEEEKKEESQESFAEPGPLDDDEIGSPPGNGEESEQYDEEGTEGNGEGANGEGEENDEDEEGEEGSGDAEGEGGGAEGEGDEEEGDEEGEGDEEEGEGDEEEGDEEGEGSSGSGEAEEGDEEDTSGKKEGRNEAGEDSPATPKDQQDLLGLNEIENPADPEAVYSPDTSSLLSEEAKAAANLMTTKDGRYLVYTTEFDKIGNSDELMSQLARNYKVDELKEKKLYNEIAKKADQHVGVLRRRLRSLLTSQVKPKHHRDLEDGDLDFDSLWKMTLKRTSDQSRIFQRTSFTFDNKDVCVALAVNESGSMSNVDYTRCLVDDPTGALDWNKKPKQVPSDARCKRYGYCMGHGSTSRIELAREVGIIFGEVLADLGVSFKVYGHTAEPTPISEANWVSRWSAPTDPSMAIYTRLGALVLITYKDWEERYNTVKHRLTRMDARSNTYDAEALMRIAQDILQRKERRKVIFMLDDGIPEPSDHNGDKHRKFLKEVVKDITKLGVEVISLGMATDAVKEYYPNSVVIKEAADTPMVAAAELKKILLKSMRAR